MAIRAPASVHSPAGKKARPARRAAVAVHLLEVEREEEVHTEQGGTDGDRDPVGGRQGAAPEDPERDQRIAGEAGLVDEEEASRATPIARVVIVWADPHE